MKPILPNTHAIADYLLAIFLAIAPTLWGFDSYASHMAYVLAGIFITMSLLTDYSGGLIKIVGFQIHGLFELFIAVAVIIIAYKNLQSDETARHFFILLGIAILMFWVLSDYTYIAPDDKHRHFNTH